MGETLPTPPPGFDELSPDEKVEYIQDLWDRVVADPDQVPVPEWHRRVLAERLARFQANTDEGRSWTDAKTRLEGLLHQRDE